MSQSTCINIHCHLGNSIPGENTLYSLNSDEASLALNSNLEHILFSVGIHPWYMHKEEMQKQLEIVEMMASKSQVMAIGETGLDKFATAPLELQQKILIHHIAISEKTRKPLMIHCVRGFSELLALHKSQKPNQTWIIHGFRGSLLLARQLIDKGIYLSFGAALCKNNKRLSDVFRELPLNRLFLETDESEITINKIYEKAAELKKLKENELKIAIEDNFVRCFKAV